MIGSTKEEKQHMFYSIDRMEGKIAVCECDDGSTVALERSKLPPLAHEGDLLRRENGAWVLDARATAERAAALRKKRANLFKGKKNPPEAAGEGQHD